MKTFATNAPARASAPRPRVPSGSSSRDRASSVILMPMVFGAMSLATSWNCPVQRADRVERVRREQVHDGRLDPRLRDGAMLEVHAHRDAGLAHLVGEDLQEPAGRRAEVEDRLTLPQQPVATEDLVDLEGGAGAEARLLRLAVVEVLRIVGLGHVCDARFAAPARRRVSCALSQSSQADMSRTKTALLCAVALAGLASTVRSSLRVRALEAELQTARATGQAEGASFVETLRGEHAERQRLAFDRRREVGRSRSPRPSPRRARDRRRSVRLGRGACSRASPPRWTRTAGTSPRAPNADRIGPDRRQMSIGKVWIFPGNSRGQA